MNKFVYIFLILILGACANNASYKNESEAADITTEEKTVIVSEDEAYRRLIFQKIQEQLDKKNILDKHPEFNIDVSDSYSSIPEKASVVKSVSFLEDLKITLDTTFTIKTKVVYTSASNKEIVDTLLTKIKTSEISIDGTLFKTNEIKFDSITAKKKVVTNEFESKDLPTAISKFSLKNLSFTWEEINACDCLFMIPAPKTSYKKLFLGRFKGDSSAIIQLGRNTEKFIISLKKTRSKNRKPGSYWKESYQNSLFKIDIKASPAKTKVKGKFTYYMDISFTDFTSKQQIKKVILANCKS